MGVSELSRQTGLSKTAVFKILLTFERRRLVRRDETASRYRLGWGVHELGARLLAHHGVAGVAKPFLGELSERTGETVLVGVLDGARVTYIDRHETARAIRMVAAPGRQGALHATASGKVLLAHQPDDFVDRVLGEELERFSPTTITDPERLREVLRHVLDDGYGLSETEHEPEISSIAVPVRDYTGAVVAALTLAGPASRFTTMAMRAALPTLTDVGERLSQELGAGVASLGLRAAGR